MIVTEIDPICALQAAMEGYEVKTLDDVVETADIFVTTTGNYDIITADHMARMKDKAIVGNIGHFDNEIDMAGLEKIPGIQKTNIKPQYDEWSFPDGHSDPGARRRSPAQPGLRHRPPELRDVRLLHQPGAGADRAGRRTPNEYEKKVYVLPKELDEEVARLHLDQLGVKLTTLSQEQADYIGVPVDGPYKPDHYRY